MQKISELKGIPAQQGRMDSARNGLANFLVSKQLEADAELLELHGLTSAPPSVPG